MPANDKTALEMVYKARWRRPWTPENLRDYIACYYKRTIPDYPNGTPCGDHDSPFAYMVGSNLTEKDMAKWTRRDRARFSPHDSCVVHACRSGGKTEAGGISAHLKAIHIPNCGITILGGSQKQSERMHNVTRLANRFMFSDMILGDPTASRTRFRNGSNIEILVQSATSVRSPHVPILMLDEVDEFDEGIYGDAQGIPQTMNGIRSRVEEFSTAHRPGGLMERVIKGYEQAGRRVYRWCIFEVLKKCPYPCTPKKPYKKCAKMVKYDALNVPHYFHEICDRRAKRGAGYYEITDLWQKFLNPIWTYERFSCEMLCEMPKLEDAAFPMIGKQHLIGDWPVEQWGGDVGKGRKWRLVMGADAGPVNSWVVWVVMGRLYDKDDFDTAVVVKDYRTNRRMAASDFADLILMEHERAGIPKAEALFLGPRSVPQDSYLAAELDKVHRRSRLFVSSWQQPEGRRCCRLERESAEFGWEGLCNLLAMRHNPQGDPIPRLMICKPARATYESLLEQQRNAAEDHGVAALRYAVRGWTTVKGTFLHNENGSGFCVVAI